jgi:hypothetical protein
MKLAVTALEPPASVGDDSERLARRYIGLLATAFVLIFAIVWAYTATLPMAFLSRDYPAWLAKRAMLDSCGAGAVAIFGDSRAMAGIDPALLPSGGTNFAFSGSSPIEAHFAVERMLRCKAQPKLVVLAYSVGTYMSDVDYWTIGARVGILSFADMRDVARESRLLHDDEIDRLASGDHLAPLVRQALVAARFPSFYFGSLINGFGFGRYFYNRRTEGVILAARGHALFGTAAESHEVASEIALPQFAPSPLVNFYFQSLLTAFAQRKIPVVILSLPINEATCHVMDPSLRPGLAAYLRHAISADPQARIAGPAMPCWPDRFFGDAFHLNETGAHRYTAMAVHWLQPATPQAAAARIVER